MISIICKDLKICMNFAGDRQFLRVGIPEREGEIPMKIELIAVDLDGTVLRDDKTVSPRTMRALKAASAQGVQVLPATGRVAEMVPEQMLRIPGVRYLLTSNGANVVDLANGSSLYTRPMSLENSMRVARLFTSRKFFVEAYCRGVSYANAGALQLLRKAGLPSGFFRYIEASQTLVRDLPDFLENNGLPLEKVNLPYVPAGDRKGLAEEILSLGHYSVTSSGRANLEVNDAGASKADGLSHLCRSLGIDRRRVMAVGDGDNDRSMIRFAGFGVAMGNAGPDLIREADYVTGTNESDGVAAAVEKFVLRPGPL